MSATDLTIRPATAGDTDAAVPLIYSAGPQAFDWTFAGGASALPFLMRVFPTGRGFFGCQNHHVAVLDGRVVGTIAVYSAAEYRQMSRDTLLQVFRYRTPWQWPRVLQRCLANQQWMPPPRRRMDYVANLGVAQDLRSRGIGAALLAFGEDYARQRGKSVYALDVADSNPRAEALYRRLGFQLSGTQHSPSPGVVPGARRLEKQLLPATGNSNPEISTDTTTAPTMETA